MSEVTQVNCSPIKPSFKGKDRTETIRAIADFIDDAKGRPIDEDTFNRARGIVESIEDDPNSKIRGPLKNFALTALTLGTGVLVTKAGFNRAFTMVEKSKFGPKLFEAFGSSLEKFTTKAPVYARALRIKAAQSGTKLAKAKSSIAKAINWAVNKATPYLEKGIKETKGTVEFATAKATRLAEVATNYAGLATGVTTAGLTLSVDKDKNGKSDVLEGKADKKKSQEREALMELAATVLDAI